MVSKSNSKITNVNNTSSTFSNRLTVSKITMSVTELTKTLYIITKIS